jgi:lipoprotein-anchoring transpeptidase ErfK/SrfK
VNWVSGGELALSTARRVVGVVGLVLGLLLATVLLATVGAIAAAVGTASAAPGTTGPPVVALSAAVLPTATRARASQSATPCAVTAKACMDLSNHQAWLTDGAGNVIYGPVAARGGTPSAPTPVGTFHVLSKNKHFYSTEFHAPMPYSVFFYPGDALHADNTSVASNGCIHLNWSSAQRFYNFLNLGDQVQIVN